MWNRTRTKRYRFGFNGKENDNEVKGTGNQLDFGARIYDPRIGRFLSIDPYSNRFVFQTPYLFASNNPLLNIDQDGNYSVAVHYRVTYNTLIKLGYSKSVADNIAHHASVYADHPEPSVLYVDNLAHNTNHTYRPNIDYSKTEFSQKEWRSVWHSMMSDAEASKGMSHSESMKRGLSFGWSNIFSQQNEKDVAKLGQGLHALQDAYAHKGASTNEHLGANASSAQMVANDMYGNTAQAELITKSAGVLLQLFDGITTGLEDGMLLDFNGMSSSQLKTATSLFNKSGYNLNSSSGSNYILKKIETTEK